MRRRKRRRVSHGARYAFDLRRFSTPAQQGRGEDNNTGLTIPPLTRINRVERSRRMCKTRYGPNAAPGVTVGLVR